MSLMNPLKMVLINKKKKEEERSVQFPLNLFSWMLKNVKH